MTRKNNIPEASSTQSQLHFIGNWFVIICITMMFLVLVFFVDVINLLKLSERCDWCLWWRQHCIALLRLSKETHGPLHLAVSFKAGVCVLIVTRIRRGDGLVVLALQPTGNVRCKVTAARGRWLHEHSLGRDLTRYQAAGLWLPACHDFFRSMKWKLLR